MSRVEPVEAPKTPEKIWSEPGYESLFTGYTDSMLINRRLPEADVLLFLDKSARPVSWYIAERLRYFFPDRPMPAMRYLNIGANLSGTEGTRGEQLGRSAYQDLEESVRNHILIAGATMADIIPPAYPSDDAARVVAAEAVAKLFHGQLDHKQIVVIDEWLGLGHSLLNAMDVVQRAAPQAEVRGAAVAGNVQSINARIRGSRDNLFPWSAQFGMTGVLELPNDDLVTGRVSPEHIALLDVKRIAEYNTLVTILLERLQPNIIAAALTEPSVLPNGFSRTDLDTLLRLTRDATTRALSLEETRFCVRCLSNDTIHHWLDEAEQKLYQTDFGKNAYTMFNYAQRAAQFSNPLPDMTTALANARRLRTKMKVLAQQPPSQRVGWLVEAYRADLAQSTS